MQGIVEHDLLRINIYFQQNLRGGSNYRKGKYFTAVKTVILKGDIVVVFFRRHTNVINTVRCGSFKLHSESVKSP